MDRLSQLPEALLLRIMSLLPAKDVVATMVLSKQWQLLWMLVPKLVYDDSYQDIEYGRFSRFVDRSLTLHEAPVLDTLHLKLGKTSCGSGDIRVWIKAVDKRCLRELIVEFDSNNSSVVLPVSLYTCCRMLVTLKLNNAVLVDVTSSFSFPSLKNLSLVSMKYPGDELIKTFLSSCPVLEDLVVKRCLDDNVTIFNVRVSSLKFLVLHNKGDPDSGFVIDTPSLECLDIFDNSGEFCVIENDMTKIVKADVCFDNANAQQLLGSISSVKRLYLCVPFSKDAYPVGSVFHCLVSLTLCTCETEWLNLLMCMLRDSPKLRALKLIQDHSFRSESRPCWNEPSAVPECLLTSLETLEWVKYEGKEEEKELAAFILRNGNCLKRVTISSKSTDLKEKYEILKELSLLSRRSPTCQIAFN
ncbi:PREDICTED: probable FBD-associated F-box protein At1g32375 [Camelina sativa]|uniref:Probable FBD-associated F-box protein At1g32375 n=1 Tax=Camelina sativa TaxID=90675 RepID=A0ABM0VTY2_CAMSA|nr:PREDICTED: probable FBD-associated F-box protein At1g32375 [Camelina sativa]